MNVPYRIKTACGSTAVFDYGSGIGYRCEQCMAILGSMGQPAECKEIENKYIAWEKLGGEPWDPIIKDEEEFDSNSYL